ncbi:MAG: hypothetical protein RBU37_00520 [Myxococcota bacterium]|jgi:hypothetical protein|nr:hypothetical protein [Myxococcota bacterium]
MTFSSRHGFEPAEPEITVTNDAPEELRGIVVDIAYESGFRPSSLRGLVSRLLRVREDPNNWSEYSNIDGEVRYRLDTCQWYEVYDLIEAIVDSLGTQPFGDGRRNLEHFTAEMNSYFRSRGIGWQLLDGKVQMRGEADFEATLLATAVLAENKLQTASQEMREARTDLSRRPEPDLTGAIQHAIAALECVMWEVCADPQPTLGRLLAKYKGQIPPPLDIAVEKIWGFASERGRHLKEGTEPTAEEAALNVHVAAAVATYLTTIHTVKQTSCEELWGRPKA